MLAFSDEGLAHLVIAASRVSWRKRSRWLREIAQRSDPPAVERSPAAARQTRVRARRKNGQHVYKLELAARAVEGLIGMMRATGRLTEREAFDHRRIETELGRLLEQQGARWLR